MVGTCETCEFWAHINDGYGDCEIILDDTTGRSADEAEIFLDSLDEENDYARLTTRRDFGCTLHQEERE